MVKVMNKLAKCAWQLPGKREIYHLLTIGLQVIRDIVDSLTGSGIRKIMLLNSHGGNDLKPLLREMYGKVYCPAWLAVTTPNGPVTALSFISNTSHAQYAGGLSLEQAAAAIADAVGENGTCRDYLEQTIASLARHGLRDPGLEALLDAVNAMAPTR